MVTSVLALFDPRTISVIKIMMPRVYLHLLSGTLRRYRAGFSEARAVIRILSEIIRRPDLRMWPGKKIRARKIGEQWLADRNISLLWSVPVRLRPNIPDGNEISVDQHRS